VLAHEPDFYLTYVQSPEWRARRNRALVRAGWCCERCQSRRTLQVHHKTYERLGCEWDQDLEVLCANCHEGEHIDQMEASGDGIYFRLTRQALFEHPFDDFSSLAEVVKCLCANHGIPYGLDKLSRALTLVIGTRIQRPTPRRRPKPDPNALTDQQAHEVLCRLQVPLSIMKSIPSVDVAAFTKVQL
jgi:hypothetical protein